MDRKKWLVMVYREANIFLEQHHTPERPISPDELEELEPELYAQIQELLKSADSLEDIIKHSLLKNPSPDLWYGESDWRHVLAAVAGACLVHDIKGVAAKILDGTLPRTNPDQLFEKLD